MGEVAVVLCPACREPTAAGDRFCEACGHELGGGAQAPVVEAAAGGAEPGLPEPPVPEAPVPEARVVATCPACGTEDPWLDGWCSVCGARQPDPREHLEAVLPGVAGVTDRGRRHRRNEDAMAVGQGAGCVVAVVCDGVSLSQRPQDASQAAADAALAALLATDPAAPDMLAAYRAARDAVLAIPVDAGAELGPPSCTYLAAVVTDARVTLASLGDCRSYWVAAGEARHLTADHSWAAEAVAAGMAPEEASADPRANAITRWLAADADPAWEPDVGAFEPPGPGVLLLVSDGLWKYAPDPADLLAVLSASGSEEPLARARALVAFANDAGGSDNITVVTIDLPLAATIGPTEAPASMDMAGPTDVTATTEPTEHPEGADSP